MDNVKDALLTHPEILKVHISEHIHFDTDDVVGIRATIKKRTEWKDNVVVWTYVDRALLDSPEAMAPILIRSAEDWIDAGAPNEPSFWGIK